MAKKRKPQDATIRNVRAAAKRTISLIDRVTALEARVGQLARAVDGRLDAIERVIGALPKTSSLISELDKK